MVDLLFNLSGWTVSAALSTGAPCLVDSTYHLSPPFWVENHGPFPCKTWVGGAGAAKATGQIGKVEVRSAFARNRREMSLQDLLYVKYRHLDYELGRGRKDCVRESYRLARWLRAVGFAS